MAFVFDHSDPSNLGMFSKAGRFTTEKYIIFHKKDEILNNQRKFLKVTSLPHLKMDFDGKDHNRSFHEDEEAKLKREEIRKKKQGVSPMSVQMSREDFYQSKRVRHPPPPCGFYNPKYDLVEKTGPTLFKWDKEKTRTKFRSTMTDFDKEEASRPLPEKPKKKVPTPISLDQQLPRGAVITPGNNPHEKRFEAVVSPQNWSNMRKTLSFDLRKSMGRSKQLLYKNLEYAPDYTPNYEVGRKQLGSCGPEFQKNCPRKTQIYSSYYKNEDFFDPLTSCTLRYPRTKNIVFERSIRRDPDPNSPFPSFMQKSIHSRLSIGMLNQKTLENNNFSDGKFQTMTSSFFPGSPAARMGATH